MSNKIKLSALALKLYEEMKTGVTCFLMHPFRGGKSYYFRSDNLKKCTRQVKALLDAGLVEGFYESMRRGYRVRVKRSAEEESVDSENK